MPDLAQGYSADIVLNANESVRVRTSGQVTVTSAYGAPAGTTTLNANTQLFGPYGVPAKLRVTAVSGTANYAQPTQVPVTANPATGEFTPPVSGARNSVGGLLSLFGHQINTAGVAASFVLQSPALAAFYGSRTYHANYGTSAQTITEAKSAVSPTANNNGLSLTWANRRWAGATTVLQPAGSGTGSDVVPSIVVSDWLWVPSIARTDFPTRNFLIQERAYYAASGSVQRSVPANAMGDLYTASALEFATNVAAGADAVSTITSFAPAPTNTWMCPIGVEFSYGVPTVTVADVGDSLMRGQESSTATNGWQSVTQRACAINNGATIWQPASFAITGQTHAASYLTGLEVASKVAPRYLCFRAWSPNDGSPTQALIDAAWGRTLALIEHCRRNNVIPVLCTTPPRNSLSAGEDAFLKVQNARVKALAGTVLVSDEAAAVEDPADRSKLAAWANGGDGLHISNAGYAAMAAVRARVLT